MWSHKLSNDPNNIMLLCNKHHILVDAEETKANFSIKTLTNMKYKHEQFVALLTDVLGKPETHIITYSATVGYNQVLLTKQHFKDAVIPEFCPRLDQLIRLDQDSLPSSLDDGGFWDIHFKSLRELYRSDVRSRIRRNEIDHITVFAIAPIPLLIELGRLLSDITPTHVKQLHREPNTWTWQNDVPIGDISVAKVKKSSNKTVALSVEISAEINPERVEAVLGTE